MRIPLETETFATHFAANHETSGHSNSKQRDYLLPIHVGKDNPKTSARNKGFSIPTPAFFGMGGARKVNPKPEGRWEARNPKKATTNEHQ
jgi:hypothetical protein